MGQISQHKTIQNDENVVSRLLIEIKNKIYVFNSKYPLSSNIFHLFFVKSTHFQLKSSHFETTLSRNNFTLMVFANSSETSFHNWHLSIFLGGASFRIKFKFFRLTIWSRLYKVVCWNANWISFIDLKKRVDSSVSFAWRCDRTTKMGLLWDNLG